MANHGNDTSLEKLAKFDVLETTYKIVNDQDIKAFVLIPKNITGGKHPVIVEWHGGFLVSTAHHRVFEHYKLTCCRSPE